MNKNLYMKLDVLNKLYPDLRAMQLMYFVTSKYEKIPFYVTDRDLDKIVENMISEKQLELYPWLRPRNYDEQVILAVKDPDQSFYSMLDMEIPFGWQYTFVQDMVVEIDAFLKEHNIENYLLGQAKEKYGELRWYDSGIPSEHYDEFQKIIDKYENISTETCIHCGRPAKMNSRGWISPLCRDHWPKEQEWPE